jgi:hypothetical protein
MLYFPAMIGCVKIEVEPNRRNGLNFAGGRWTTDEHFESNLTAIDPITFEIEKSVHLPYPNYSGILSTGGGIVFLALHDGTIAAFDDTTLEQLRKINVGSGFSAPPMTYEFNGRQYVAIASGASNTAIRLMPPLGASVAQGPPRAERVQRRSKSRYLLRAVRTGNVEANHPRQGRSLRIVCTPDSSRPTSASVTQCLFLRRMPLN